MKLSVSESMLELFPTLAIGVVQGEITATRSDAGECLAGLRREAEQQLERAGLDTGSLSTHPHMAGWRKAYQAFGVKAKRHKPTHEALVRRLLQGQGWPEVNPVVDVYLTNQVAHLLPHGGYDTSSICGDLELTIATEAEQFEPLGGGEEFTTPGEVIYRDSERVLTRRWNYRDCERAKIRADSEAVVMFIESPSGEIPADAVKEAAIDLCNRCAKCFAGEFKWTLFQPRPDALSIDL